MKLSEVAIQRPVLASMASAALVLFGVIGYTRLSVRELPDIDPPIISVSTTLPGANAQGGREDRKSTRLNSSHGYISYAVFCLKKKKTHIRISRTSCYTTT